MATEPTDFLPTIHRLFDAGGPVLMQYFGRLGEHRDGIQKKGQNDLVTVADSACEEALKALLAREYPSHEILAEESGFAPSQTANVPRWIIDPLDGTTNFAHGFPQFSISIAVEVGGRIFAGGVFNPHNNERFVAARGAGATLNGAPIRVSAVPRLSEALMVTGFPYEARDRVPHYMRLVGEMLARGQGMLRLGSAALDCCAVAAGRVDVYYEQMLNPWDVAAGQIILEEAGGRITDFHGGEFSCYRAQTLATNGLIHDECIEVLRHLSPPPEN